jgi:hypothetical protein
MKKKREKPFHLDMPFDEALRHYAQVDPREVAERGKKTKRRRERLRSTAKVSSTQPDT